MSREFQAAFRAHADAAGTMTFARFMALALYDPAVGYYRQPRSRVGYGAGSDFYTASTSGTVFGELVCAAAVKRLRDAGRDPSAHAFVEIGAEPERTVLRDVRHPFARAHAIRLGQPLELSGDCVVFSNELFDAQPFTRLVFRAGRWWEVGVQLEGERLVETLQPCTRSYPGREGYQLDDPTAAAGLARTIAGQPWRGLFVAFDYGKSLRELLEATPAGTSRAYYRHTQSNDLLARPGEQDLTCHICWDWMTAALTENGFRPPALDSQEAFFIRNAGEAIAAASAAQAGHFSPKKASLLQLLHPAQMGQKFQVLHAIR